MNLSLSPLADIKYKSDHQLYAISVLKFILALMVIQGHSGSLWRDSLMPLIRVAVPCFFMISGYFLLMPDGTFSLARLKKTFRSVAAITISANLFYIGYGLFSYCVLNRNADDILEGLYDIRAWIRAVFLGDSFCGHLWYLNAYLEVLAVIYLFVKIRTERLLYPVAVLGVLANLVFGGYSCLFFDTSWKLEISRNFFTMGIPAVMAGVWIRRTEHKMDFGNIALAFMLLAGVAAVYLERACYLKEMYYLGDLFIFTLPLAMLVLIAALRASEYVTTEGVFAYVGAKYSLDIYIYHYLVYIIIHTYTGYGYKDAEGLIVLPLTFMVIIGINMCRVAGRRIRGYLPGMARTENA